MTETYTVIMFVFTLVGSVSSYFKAMSDVRQQIQAAMFSQAEKLRDEMRAQYATKEDMTNQKDLLREIKADLKEIKATLATRN